MKWQLLNASPSCLDAMAPNHRIKLTVRPVTSLAKSASAAPGRPAAYAER